MKKIATVFLSFLLIQNIFAQDISIGAWRIHAGLEDVVAIADAGDKVFCASHLGLFSVDKLDHSFVQYSKATGLSDVGISTIAWCGTTKTLVIAYTNSNIDLLYASGTVVNINDIQQKSMPGDKTIYQIAFNGSTAYLACGFGVVNLNISKQEIEDTYVIGAGGVSAAVTAIAIQGNQLWAQLKSELKYIDFNSPLISDYQYWNAIALPKKSTTIVSFNNSIFSLEGDSVMELQNGSWQVFHYVASDTIFNLKANAQHLILSYRSRNNDSIKLVSMDKNFKIANQFYLGSTFNATKDVVEDVMNKSFWVGDVYNGMYFFDKNNSSEKLVPNANHYNSAYAFTEKNNTLWVAGGMVNNYESKGNINGFYAFDQFGWHTHDRYANPALDSVADMIACAVSPDGSQVYFGSFGEGLVQYSPSDDVVTVYNKHNSILTAANGDPNSVRVPDLNFDAEGNLWMTNNLATKPIVVKKADGTWKNFAALSSANALTKIIVDKNDQKWMLVNGGGILVYNSGTDIDNTQDDQYRLLVKGAGYGNLPSNNVSAIAEDKDGQIWLGTDAGVAIIYDAADIIQGGDAQQIIVTNATDSIANYLFASENITDIKVDGANRKWVSSAHGVWLMSSDGLKEIYHFTKDNSPLMSDNVLAIGINNSSGEVFFATDLGMCSFRSDATKGGDTNDNVYAFPNPVPHDYSGTIAIKGLVDDAFVKITDVNGQLIYSTKALGGQAVWNGKNLQGLKTATGVYLVFATNDTGTETVVAKILYNK